MSATNSTCSPGRPTGRPISVARSLRTWDARCSRSAPASAGRLNTCAAVGTIAGCAWNRIRRLAGRLEASIASGELPACCQVEVGTTHDRRGRRAFDTVLYIDVLEHISDDGSEVARASQLLRPGGYVVALSPAHQMLFTPFDAAIGHYRRYSKQIDRGADPSRAPAGSAPLPRFRRNAGLAGQSPPPEPIHADTKADFALGRRHGTTLPPRRPRPFLFPGQVCLGGLAEAELRVCFRRPVDGCGVRMAEPNPQIWAVTGAAGYLGSHVDALLARGTTVLAVDDFSVGHREYLAAHRDNPLFGLVEADVRNAAERAAGRALLGSHCGPKPTVDAVEAMYARLLSGERG